MLHNVLSVTRGSVCKGRREDDPFFGVKFYTSPKLSLGKRSVQFDLFGKIPFTTTHLMEKVFPTPVTRN